MAPTLSNDPERIGFALLTLDDAATDPLSISISIVFADHSYLGPGGRRSRERHLFTVPRRGAASVLGPDISAHIWEDEVVTLADASGRALGTLVWEGIRPPPGQGRGAHIAVRPAIADTAAVPIAPQDAAPVATEPPPDLPGEVEPVEPSPPLLTLLQLPPPQPPPRWRRYLAPALLIPIAIVLVAAGLVLTGWIGWRLDTGPLRFAGPKGGPFTPAGRHADLTLDAAARALAVFVSRPFRTERQPDWLAITQVAPASGTWRLAVAIDAAHAGRLATGRYAASIPIGFPIPLGERPLALSVELQVQPSPAPPHPQPAPPIRAPAPPPRTRVDDAACDRVAGNRFDADHPAGRGFGDDIFGLSAEALAEAIDSCDPRTDRTGPDRRYLAQRGRLLAAAAVHDATAGDLDKARREMAAAVAAWTAASALGSGLADNLLGAYFSGTYNRPQLAFVPVDEGRATSYWRKGFAEGNTIAQTNFAAQLLGGHGIAADPDRALALLREALSKGYVPAAGILGVALYTGFPHGVPVNKDEGWSLITQAQCVDGPSAKLMGIEIGAGRRPAEDRRSCN